jgi:hypothetical protein
MTTVLDIFDALRKHGRADDAVGEQLIAVIMAHLAPRDVRQALSEEGELVWAHSRLWPNDQLRSHCACVFRKGHFEIQGSMFIFHGVIEWWPLPLSNAI